MPKIQRMSDAEKQIMTLIWSAGQPITTSEILDKLPEDKTWKQNTVVTFLARLMDKGIISAVRVRIWRHRFLYSKQNQNVGRCD